MANPYQFELQDYQTSLEQFARPARQYRHDAAGYNTALTDYNGKVKGYNTAATTFNDSFYRDASGNQAGLVNGQWTTNSPANKVGYGLYTDPTNTSQQLLRKAGTEAENVTGTFRGTGSRRVVDIPGIGPIKVSKLQSSGYILPDFGGVKQNQQITFQRANYSAAPVSPGEFTQTAPVAPVAPVAPEGTLSQMQGGATASQALTAAERGGLISDVIQGRGVR